MTVFRTEIAVPPARTVDLHHPRRNEKFIEIQIHIRGVRGGVPQRIALGIMAAEFRIVVVANPGSEIHLRRHVPSPLRV